MKRAKQPQLLLNAESSNKLPANTFLITFDLIYHNSVMYTYIRGGSPGWRPGSRGTRGGGCAGSRSSFGGMHLLICMCRDWLI